MEPVFQIPDYIVLRFNLRITHIYKGLLLGTGPVIDPGFVGRLSIPLHNLTSNEYVLYPGDEIISLEVTKLSNNVLWHNQNMNCRQGQYIQTDITPHRKVDFYINRALANASKNGIVGSVIAITQDAKKTASYAQNMVKKLQLKIKKIAWIGIIGVALSVLAIIAGIIMPSYQLIDSVVSTQTEYALQIQELQLQILDLQDEIDSLLKKHK